MIDRDELALGEVAVRLRSRGYRWDEIARALELFDTITARRLAVAYLLSLSETHGERAGEGQGRPATSASSGTQRTVAAAREAWGRLTQ